MNINKINLNISSPTPYLHMKIQDQDNYWLMPGPDDIGTGGKGDKH